MQKIAKLAIQSALPQLDRLFDFVVPEVFADQIHVGSRVRIQFGSSKKLIDGYVVELSGKSDFPGKLSNIVEVISDRPQLLPKVHKLCQQMAERAAVPIGEVIKLAVPAHMPRSLQQHDLNVWSEINKETFRDFVSSSKLASRVTKEIVLGSAIAEPRLKNLKFLEKEVSIPSWAAIFLEVAIGNLATGKSTILVVPDFRDHQIINQALEKLGFSDWVADYSQEQPKSKQYLGFLKALDANPRIVLGSRLAAFAPAHNLGAIMIFDESDHSYIDQSSPYLHTRDVVLVRQTIERCSLVFLAHSVSSDIQRLLQSGYLENLSISFANPSVSISEPGFRVDSHAYKAIRRAITEGPVLVQVASLGESTAIFCKSCDTPARCSNCLGPIWIDSNGARKCRWCNSFSLDTRCVCGSTEFSLGRAGVTRTAKEFGKAFPNVRLIESTGDKRLVQIPSEKCLVIATAGAEPYVEGGYTAVILLDAKVLLSRQSLRAQEDAVRLWSNAIAKGANNCSSVLVGVSGELSRQFSLWNHFRIAQKELISRIELGLPPALRVGSVTSDLGIVSKISEVLSQFASVQTIGPAPIGGDSNKDRWRLLFKYSNKDTIEIAKELKAAAAKLGAGKSRHTASGRSARLVTLKMNDLEVV